MALLFPLNPLAFNFGELVAAFTVGVVSGRWGVSMVVIRKDVLDRERENAFPGFGYGILTISIR